MDISFVTAFFVLRCGFHAFLQFFFSSVCRVFLCLAVVVWFLVFQRLCQQFSADASPSCRRELKTESLGIGVLSGTPVLSGEPDRSMGPATGSRDPACSAPPTRLVPVLRLVCWCHVPQPSEVMSDLAEMGKIMGVPPFGATRGRSRVYSNGKGGSGSKLGPLWLTRSHQKRSLAACTETLCSLPQRFGRQLYVIRDTSLLSRVCRRGMQICF